MIGDERGSIRERAGDAALQADSVATINECARFSSHTHAPCLGSKFCMATRISAMRAAASLAQRSPFSAVAGEVQRRIATQQLKCAETRIEDVAANSGYSDAANFRRAFIRWTSMSPAQFRRAQQRAR